MTVRNFNSAVGGDLSQLHKSGFQHFVLLPHPSGLQLHSSRQWPAAVLAVWSNMEVVGPRGVRFSDLVPRAESGGKASRWLRGLDKMTDSLLGRPCFPALRSAANVNARDAAARREIQFGGK